MGQYTQVDPIGLAGGNPTLYGYVFSPWFEIDPFGLKIKCRVATRTESGVSIGEDISLRRAIQRVRNGGDVFVDSLRDARRLSKLSRRGRDAL